MKRLLHILPFNLLVILFVYLVCYLVTSNIELKSKYLSNTTEITGVITKINIDSDKIKFNIKANETIVATYYYKEKEINNYVLGQTIKVTGALERFSPNTNFYLFNYQKYMNYQKIFYNMKVIKIETIDNNISFFYKLKNSINKRIDTMTKSKSYLSLLLFGNKSLVSDEIMNSYNTNGISHLFSISGLHISVLVGILTFLFRKFKYYKVLICLLLMMYIFLTSFSIGVIRSALMYLLLLINNKRYKSVNVLIFLMIILLVINPFYIYNIGFNFSFLISIYLMNYSDIIKRSKGYFLKLFKTSLICFLTSTPIMINSFNSINIMSIFLNLIFVPFVSLIILPVSLIAFFINIELIDNILYFLINIMESISMFWSNFEIRIVLGRIDLILIVAYMILITIVLSLWQNKKYKGFIILLVILFIHTNINYFRNYAIVEVIDVSQGDSILISFPHNSKNILIDTGGNKKYDLATKTIIPRLYSLGIKKIDYLILTHGDYDHMGASFSLINNIKVDNVIFNSGEYNDLEKNLITILKEKRIKYFDDFKILNINNWKVHFLNTKEIKNENENSRVIYLNYNNTKMLFMGDAGTLREKDILDKYNLDNIDILKVGHHGSDTSSSEYFINKISPKNCFISVGKNNIYKHPSNSVLKRLHNCTVYRTDLHGGLQLKLFDDNYFIKTVN